MNPMWSTEIPESITRTYTLSTSTPLPADTNHHRTKKSKKKHPSKLKSPPKKIICASIKTNSATNPHRKLLHNSEISSNLKNIRSKKRKNPIKQPTNYGENESNFDEKYPKNREPSWEHSQVDLNEPKKNNIFATYKQQQIPKVNERSNTMKSAPKVNEWSNAMKSAPNSNAEKDTKKKCVTLTPVNKGRIQILIIMLFIIVLAVIIIPAVLLTRPQYKPTPPCNSLLWDPNGIVVAGNGTWGNASYQFYSPQDMSVDETGTIYVADYYNHRIQQWLPNAATGITVAGKTGIAAPAVSNTTLLSNPRTIFVRSNTMYIADSWNRILIWPVGASSGTILSGSTALGYISDIFVDTSGNIYAMSLSYGKVMMWTPSSKNYTILTYSNGTGYSSSQIAYSYGFTVDTTNNIVYIANSNAYTIVSWPFGATSGSIIFGWNSTFGSTDYLLNLPRDIKLDKNGNLYIADTSNSRILLLCQNPPTMVARPIVYMNLYNPLSIGFDSNMNLYVLDASYSYVKKFTYLNN